MGIEVKSSGSFDSIDKYLSKASSVYDYKKIDEIAKETVEKLSISTPKKSSKTANSWSYKLDITRKGFSLEFDNYNVQNGNNVAILINDGYSTSSGKWVSGEHYIEEPVREAYEKIMKETWEEIKKYGR